MGLLYIMPASKEEIDHVKIEESESSRKIHLFSYGLPLMFWGYFIILIGLELAMYLSISDIISKLYTSPEPLDRALIVCCTIFMGSLPLIGLGMLFWQKVISKENDKIQVSFRVFGITVRKKSYRFNSPEDYLEVKHLLESPNMAKIRKSPNTRAFENQGHYILTLWSNGKPYFLDRHTRKQDLNKLDPFSRN